MVAGILRSRHLKVSHVVIKTCPLQKMVPCLDTSTWQKSTKQHPEAFSPIPLRKALHLLLCTKPTFTHPRRGTEDRRGKYRSSLGNWWVDCAHLQEAWMTWGSHIPEKPTPARVMTHEGCLPGVPSPIFRQPSQSESLLQAAQLVGESPLSNCYCLYNLF